MYTTERLNMQASFGIIQVFVVLTNILKLFLIKYKIILFIFTREGMGPVLGTYMFFE